MRKLICLLLLLVLLVGCFSTLVKADVAPTLNDGLVLYFPFDEGSGTIVNDLSGSNLDGTITDAVYCVGRYSYGLQFASNNAQVVVANRDFSSYVGAVSFWLNVSALDSENTVFCMFQDWNNFINFLITDSGLINFRSSIGGSTTEHVFYGAPISISDFDLITVSQSGTGLSLYVNDTLKGFVNSNAWLNSGGLTITSDLIIGHMQTYSDLQANCLDDFRIYDIALSQTDVDYLFSGSSPSATPTNSNLPTQSGFDWGGLVVLVFLVVGCLFVMGWFNRLWFFGVIFGLFAFVIGVYVSVSGVWSVSQVAGYFSMFEMFVAVITILVSALRLRVKR